MDKAKYKVIRVINHDEWLSGCPLLVLRSQIIQNNQSKRLFVLNELANIGKQNIREAILKVDCLDAENNIIMSMDNCVYQMLNIKKQCLFGGNKIFSIFEETDTVVVTVKSVTMTDGNVWTNKDLKRGVCVRKPVRIDKEGAVHDVVMMRCEKSHVTPKFWPYVFEGGWRCTCAQLNIVEQEECTLCGTSKKWILMNLNRKQILKNKDLIKEEMRLMAEQEAEELRRLEEEQRIEEERVAAIVKAREEKLMAQREAVHQYNEQVAKDVNRKWLTWIKRAVVACVIVLFIFKITRPEPIENPEKNTEVTTSANNYVVEKETEKPTASSVVHGQMALGDADKEQTTEKETIIEPVTEPVKEPETEPEPTTESVKEPETESVTKPIKEPETERETEKEKVTEPPTQMEADGGSIELVFENISTATKASNILFEAGLIDSVEGFNQYLTETGLVTKVGEGTFRFEKGMSYEEIAKIITRSN